jgi:signal transduction histidine kinase
MNLPRIRIGLPRSLVGRMVLLLGIALAIAQLANFGLILNERQKLSLAQNDGPAITRFAVAAADMAEADPAFREAMIADLSHRGARYAIRADSGIAEALRSEPTEARLAQNLRDLDRGGAEVRATAPRSQAANARPGAQPERFALSFAAKLPDGQWLTGSLPTPRRDPWFAARLAAATLLLYALVLSATLLIARHLARPLKDLTEAAHGFRGRTVPATVTPRGPDDLRDAIEAFNAMNQRLAALLDEKDGMLGAIGHDLRTPLASLRIRLESMDPPEERAAAVRKVEEMAGTLEDILALASSGRQRETIRPTDITALVETVVEEFQDLGAEVQWSPAGRQVLPAQPGQLKRAVQNLIANAVKYGGGARVSVVSTSGALLIEVADDGPGIAADELEQVMRPFYRIENSRNRETGGTGLGLAITKAIAESHGGMLTLETSPNGLTARISLPR